MLIKKHIMAEEKKVEVITSKQFTVNLRDITKGLLYSGIATAILTVYPIINSGNWPVHADWVVTIKGATASMLGYLIRKFFEPAQTIVKTTPPVTEKEKQEIKEVIQDKQNEKKP